jgi:hypothetical protein
MPYYTEGYPFCVTLPNDIREGNPNPFASLRQIFDSTFVDGVGDYVYEVTRPLVPNSKLPDGEAENYKRLYYNNLYSAPTTANYTDMEQHLFINKANVITGWQNKSI